MKKIVHYIDIIKPGGGPMGYLYNLKQGILQKADKELKFEVYSNVEYSTREVSINNKEEIFRKIMSLVPAFVSVYIHYWYYILKLKRPLKKKVIKKLSSYESVIIHSFPLFSRYLKSGYNKNQKIYCMNHSPVSFSEELVEYISDFHKTNVFKTKFLKRFSNLELLTYSKSSGMIVPCKEAIEGYFYYNNDIKNKFRGLTFKEVPTGMRRLIPKRSYLENREKLNNTTNNPKLL